MEKKNTPQKAMMREFMQSYLKENDVKIKDGADVNSIMRDMMSVILEGALDEKLGYSKYDYRNKETNFFCKVDRRLIITIFAFTIHN